jgi:hypothetical protein
MRYACLVYHGAEPITDVSEAEQLAAIVAACDAAGAWKAELEKGGHHVFTAGLQSVRTATTVRNRDGKLGMTEGPFAETKEVLGGFTIVEARDLNQALQLASKLASPLLTVEVRPVLDANAALTDPLDRKIAAALRGQSRPPGEHPPEAR